MVTKAQREAHGEQFPSLADQKGVEVAKRSQDVDEFSTTEHRKVFVLTKAQWSVGDKSEIHENNIRAMRQYMEQQGLRPTDDGRFVGEEENPDDPAKLSVNLTYAVGAEPAIVAVKPEVSHAPVDPKNDAGDSGLPTSQPSSEPGRSDGKKG